MERRDNSRRNTSPNLVSIDEVRYLRAEVARLKGQKAPSALEVKGEAPKATVELKPDLQLYPILRDLLVATENRFNLVKGDGPDSAGAELRKAMASAARVVRKEKKP